MLTVMMASRNGAGWIGQCLDSFCALETPPGGYKLVIIDNASTDGTSDIVRAYRDRLPVTLLFQPKPGKNRALNLGLEHIAGDLVVFTDDDVIAAPDWLVQWRRAADQFPEFGIFGGTIKPRWRKAPPEWLLEIINIAMVYGLTGEWHDGPIHPTRVFGANMVVRTQLFKGGQRYDETIGTEGTESYMPDGTVSYMMDTETSFTTAMVAQGVRCRFVSSPTVCHIIREGQVDPEWVAARYTSSGRSMLKDLEKNYEGPRLFGAPRYLIRSTLQFGLTQAFYFIIRNKKLFYKYRFLYNQNKSALRELINRRKSL